MKYRSNYRQPKAILLLSLLFLIAGWAGNNPMVIFIVIPLWVWAFFSARNYSLNGEILTASYVLGLFPKAFDLRQVKRVKIIESNISPQYTLQFFSTKSIRRKRINVELAEGKKFKIHGDCLDHQDYIKLIKKIKGK